VGPGGSQTLNDIAISGDTGWIVGDGGVLYQHQKVSEKELRTQYSHGHGILDVINTPWGGLGGALVVLAALSIIYIRRRKR
jgi:LPXTG-motif cell wall-anchored protein